MCGGWTAFTLTLLLPLALAACPGDDTATLGYGAATNPTGSPIGGGPLYARIVSRSSATTVVSNSTQLLAALAGAASGDVVYIEDDAEIDLTGHGSISIPKNVTLASGRGNNGSRGALLYVTEAKGYSQLFIPQ